MTVPEFPDTQDKNPDVAISLTKVGVTGVKKLLKLPRGENKRPIVCICRSSINTKRSSYVKKS